MRQKIAVLRKNALLPALAIGLGVLAVEIFLSDLGVQNLRSWGAAGIVVAAVSCAALALPRDSLARALVWFLTLPVAGFLVLYDLIDSLLDPYVNADWPIAGVSFLLVLLLEAVLLAAMNDED
jgi:hypothetical protein